MKIKKQIIIAMFLLLLVGWTMPSQAQKIYPDDNFHWEYQWANNKQQYLRFYNYNGNLLSLKINKDEDFNICNYSQNDQEFSHLTTVASSVNAFSEPIAFTFQEKMYCYFTTYKMIEAAYDLPYDKYFGNFYCSNGDLKTWTNYSVNNLDDGEVKYYSAICPLDSLVYMFYTRTQELTMPGYGNKYNKHNTPYVDICSYDTETEKFVIEQTKKLSPELNSSRYFEVSSAFAYADADTTMKIFATCDMAYADENHDYGGYVLNINPDDWTYETLYVDNDMYNVEAISGSVQGQSTSASGSDGLQNIATRFQVFYSYFTEGGFWHNDNGELHYLTYALTSNGLEQCANGTVHQSNSNDNPENWNQNQISLSYIFEIKDLNPAVTGADSYEQKLWVCHQDKNYNVVSNIFNSDIWVAIPETTVESDDLHNTDKYGDDIQDLWTLVGITDGAPPCSIDWDKWESHHYGAHPTEIIFGSEQSTECTVTASSKDVFNASLSAGIPKILKGSLKFSDAFSNMESSSGDTTVGIEQTISLSEDGQDNGRYLWLIPVIQRTSYAIFPWWDSQYQNPVHLSEQYRFVTLGQSLKVIPEPLDNSVFNVSNANDSTMIDWSSEYRPHDDYAVEVGLLPRILNWNGLDPGQVGFVKVDSTDVSSYKTQQTYSASISGGFKIPAVFEIKGGVGGSLKYGNENETKTDKQNSIKISLEALTNKDMGPRVEDLTINTYVFQAGMKHNGNFWYVDSLNENLSNKQSPWYVAYIVTSASPVNLIYPPNDHLLTEKSAMFSWTDIERNSVENKIFIGEEPNISPASLVYQSVIANKANNHILADSILEAGKTYYWCISTKTNDNQIVWSETRSFSLPKDTQQTSEKSIDKAAQLTFDLYPNPLGKQAFYVRYNSTESVEVQLQIFSITGELLRTDKYHSMETENTLIEVNDVNLKPGIYFIRVSGSGKTGVNKLIVQ